MLTKFLKFDDEVLGVVRSMEWNDSGTLGKIVAQLDRKLYERVNKALDAMGGKWNRKAGGHIFPCDPRSQVEGLLSSGSLTVELDGFFETPEKVVRMMLDLVPLPNRESRILEPSAGIGAILRVLMEEDDSHSYWAVEKNEGRYRRLEEEFPSVCLFQGDCLESDIDPIFDRVYMNPPFEEMQDVDHVRHAYSLLADEGQMVSVMAESAFFRSDRKAVEFREWFDEVGGYSVELPEGSFKESGTGVKARLVVIRK